MTTILQWKREEGKTSEKKRDPQVLHLKRSRNQIIYLMKLFDESDKAIDETKMRQEEAKNPEEMLMNKEQDQKTIDLHTILIK